jgi:drug/metabolite transporter (DMT)-like permease
MNDRTRPGFTAADAPSAAGSRAGLLLLVAITLFWGANWPAIKIAVSEMPVFTFRSISLLAGGLGLLAICGIARQPLLLPRRDFMPCLYTALFNITIWNMAASAGVQHMAAGRASIVAFTMPLWAALMAVPMLKERLTATRVVGLALGLAGMGFLLLPDLPRLMLDPLGPLYMLVAALSWAFGTVLFKMQRWSAPMATIVAWQLILGAIPVVLGTLLLDRDFRLASVDWHGWAAVFYATAVCTVFCYWAWFRIVQIYPAPVAAIGTMAIPVVGVWSSAIVLGEPVGLLELIALALVLAALGVVLIVPAWRRGQGSTIPVASRPITTGGGERPGG